MWRFNHETQPNTALEPTPKAFASGPPHRAFLLRPALRDYGGQVSFDHAMKFGYRHSILSPPPVAVAKLEH
jgi:hypothetical protein